MTVIAIENAPVNLRGELCKWLLEAKPGVFIGKVSAVVREELWNSIRNDDRITGALIAYSAPTELGFIMEMTGEPTRSIVELDGLQLIKQA